MGYIQLRNYAEWYYTKYFPSRIALREKLQKKSEDPTLVERVMVDLASLIVEENVIESRIHGYIAGGKTARYIRLKLAQKKFDSELVQIALEKESSSLKNPETYRAQIERAFKKALQKGTSKKSLTYELTVKYPDARSLIEEALADYNDREILQKKAPLLLRKYSEEQVVRKLSQKGFRVNDIYTVLRRR